MGQIYVQPVLACFESIDINKPVSNKLVLTDADLR